MGQSNALGKNKNDLVWNSSIQTLMYNMHWGNAKYSHLRHIFQICWLVQTVGSGVVIYWTRLYDMYRLVRNKHHRRMYEPCMLVCICLCQWVEVIVLLYSPYNIIANIARVMGIWHWYVRLYYAHRSISVYSNLACTQLGRYALIWSPTIWSAIWMAQNDIVQQIPC